MGWALASVMEVAHSQCGYPCTGEKLNSVLETIKEDMGALMGGPIQFSPKDHYGTTWWQVSKYNVTEKHFLPAAEWR